MSALVLSGEYLLYNPIARAPVLIDGEFADDNLDDTSATYHYRNLNAVELALGTPTKDAVLELQDSAIKTQILALMNDGAIFLDYRTILKDLDEQMAQNLSGLMALISHKQKQYCTHCGATLIKNLHYANTCTHCHARDYPALRPCVIVAAIMNDQILLTEHHRYQPNPKLPLRTRRHGLVSGYIELGESAEHAVARELFEETALVAHDITYHKSQPWVAGNLMLGFSARVSGQLKIDTRELYSARFYDFYDLPLLPARGTIAHDLITLMARRHGIDISHLPTS